MTSPDNDTTQWAFGPWRFDADTGDLQHGTTTTRLEPLIAKLLARFLADQHRVISRDDLIASVWDHRVVSDDAINRCISILRQTLTPDDKNAYIETLVRRGYIAHFPPAPRAVADKAGNPVAAATPTDRRRGDRRKPEAGRARRLLALTLIGATLALTLKLVLDNFAGPIGNAPQDPAQRPPVVAVLPFAISEESTETEFFANGMHDDLLTQLAKLDSIRVISGTSVREYRDTQLNLRSIGAALGADAILEGRVQVMGDRIHINAQLIDARSDEHLWAESYNRELNPTNLFEVQSGIARSITVAMNATLTRQDDAQLDLVPTTHMAAYRAYHRAMRIRDLQPDGIVDPEYRRALEEAVLLDPMFSRAWAELASILAYLEFNQAHPETTLRAEQALAHLAAVAPGSPDHLFGQASYFYYVLRDYGRAHAIIDRALAMDPGDVRAVQLRSWIERRRGDFNAYVASSRVARMLDPRNPVMTDALLNALLITHRYDEAREELDQFSQQSHFSGHARSMLQLREHRDLARWQASLQEHCRLRPAPGCTWEAHIANRQYAQALDALGPHEDGIPIQGITETEEKRMQTYWLTQDHARTSEVMPWWQRVLEHQPRDASGGLTPTNLVPAALMQGLQGNADEAARLIGEFLGPAALDWPLRASRRHLACRVLGMIEAVQATVECLRDGLVEPSFVMPFLEPYLPFYDRVRNTPEFIAMLARIDPDGPAVGDSR